MRPAVVVLLVTVLALAGCGRAAENPAAADQPAAGGSSRPGVPGLLDFTAKTLDGAVFDGASLSGKPAVLWFWAPWCPTCAGQARGVQTTAEQLAGKVTVIGVGGLDDTEAMRRFVGQWHLQGMPHLADEAGTVWKRFGVTAQSTFVFLDATGAVVYQGALSGDDLPGLAGRLA